MAEVGVIESIDLHKHALAATAWDDVVKAQRVLDELGHYQLGSAGQIKEHSAIRIKHLAISSYERLANHLCLSPVARTRLGLAALTAKAMQREMDELIGATPIAVDADADADADAEVEDLDAVGVPGV